MVFREPWKLKHIKKLTDVTYLPVNSFIFGGKEQMLYR